MAEPASSTTLAATAALALAALLPFIDGDALLGAVLGATLIASTKKDIRWWQRLFSLALSVGLGYILAPEVINQTPVKSMAFAAFIASICAIPLALKFAVWVEQFDISSLSKLPGKGDSKGGGEK